MENPPRNFANFGPGSAAGFRRRHRRFESGEIRLADPLSPVVGLMQMIEETVQKSFGGPVIAGGSYRLRTLPRHGIDAQVGHPVYHP